MTAPAEGQAGAARWCHREGCFYCGFCYAEVFPQDRAENEAPDDPDVHYSADPDARWVKKGSKSTLGYKVFARTDEDRFIDKV